jgi:hypothetical protein
MQEGADRRIAVQGWCQAKTQAPIQKMTKVRKGWPSGSSGKALVWQVPDIKFKPHYCQKKICFVKQSYCFS